MPSKVLVKLEVPKLDEKVKKPSNVKVVIHNDNETPYPVVISVLVSIFQKDVNECEQILVNAETAGFATVCVTSRPIAEELLSLVDKYLQGLSFMGMNINLRFTIEEE